MFLILIDTHSKWIEAAATSSTSPACVIKELQSSFARFESPEMTITDIATCFTSAEFKEFLERNGVKHVTSAPYHPSSNGLAERAIQNLKNGLKETRIDTILWTYQITGHSTTSVVPAELLMGRTLLHTRLHL